MKKPFFTIGIPTYEMSGKGVIYLSELLETINKQTFKDFEVLVSDNSMDNEIKNFIDSKAFNFKLRYIENKIGKDNPSANINNIIKFSVGEYIKFIFQDDLLEGEKSLENLVNTINNNKDSKWFLSGASHLKQNERINPMIPYYNDKIHMGFNTISSPSVLTIKNDKEKIKFNEEHTWLLDCVYYKECFLTFGAPIIISSPLIINRISDTQLTNKLKEYIKYKEIIKSIHYYEKGVIKYFYYFNQSIIFLKNMIFVRLKRYARIK
jgi:glycosyltransferase involved in cell wall biosynthesis